MAGTFTNLVVHAIFSTKHRKPLIPSSFKERIYTYIAGIASEHGGQLLRSGGTADHVHLVLKLKADVAVAEMLRLIKANSSKWLNELDEYPGHFAWQRGYGAFTVSKSQLPGLFEYVDHQVEHHRYKSFQEEYREFLVRHEIEFDERYLWD